MDKSKLAEWLHDNYEELAKANDWQTQEITRVKFNDLPQANKDTMLALADRLHNTFLIIARQALVSGQLPIEEVALHAADDWFDTAKFRSDVKADLKSYYEGYRDAMRFRQGNDR